MILAIILGTVVFALGSYSSYSGIRSYSYAPLWFAFLGASAALCWHRAIRDADSTTVVQLGLLWDALAIVAYYVVPLMLLRLGLTPSQWLGVVLVISGLAMVKLLER